MTRVVLNKEICILLSGITAASVVISRHEVVVEIIIAA